jgi:hypothetical protein
MCGFMIFLVKMERTRSFSQGNKKYMSSVTHIGNMKVPALLVCLAKEIYGFGFSMYMSAL